MKQLVKKRSAIRKAATFAKLKTWKMSEKLKVRLREEIIGRELVFINEMVTMNVTQVNCITPLKADRPHPRDYLTHRQTPWTDNDSSLLFAALGKAEPLISTAAHQKFDLDL